MNFWDFFWLLIWTYVFVAYLVILFRIIGDVFRSPDLGGFAKALWVIGLIFVPFVVALIYLIARGHGMSERHLDAARQAQADADQYIQSVAGRSNPAEQVASAKALLDAGTIDQGEYEKLKAKALA